MDLFPKGVEEYDEMRSIVWDDDCVAIGKRNRKLEAVAEAVKVHAEYDVDGEPINWCAVALADLETQHEQMENPAN